MKAFKCDKCGKFFDGEGREDGTAILAVGSREAWVILSVKLQYKSPNEEERPAELCNDCITLIAEELVRELRK